MKTQTFTIEPGIITAAEWIHCLAQENPQIRKCSFNTFINHALLFGLMDYADHLNEIKEAESVIAAAGQDQENPREVTEVNVNQDICCPASVS